jgi:uncharacterized membrane protein (DUF373 family)
VFILREIMIGIYQHQSSPLMLATLAFLALVLGCLRTLAIVYSPMERRLVARLHRSESQDEKFGEVAAEKQIRSGNELQ